MELFKVLLVGETGIGKTTLLRAFKYKQFMNCNITVGLDFTTYFMKMNDAACKLVIWDFGGCRNFLQMHRENPYAVKGADGVLLAFDLSSYDTFLAIENWLELVRMHNVPDIPIVLIGTKADLPKSVSREDIRKFLMEQRIDDYIETSALNMVNVEKPFERIVELILERKLVLEDEKSLSRKIASSI